MILDDDIKLLAELNRIVDRYGPESVTRLANLLRDPQSAADLATALESAVDKPRRSGRTAKPHTTDRIGMGLINALRDSDPEKHAVITTFRDNLISGAILRSMNDIRQFASMNDLTIGKASSRNAAIVPLLRSVSEMETPEIVSLLNTTTNFETDNHSLERWRNLIVRPKPSGDSVRTNQTAY